MLQLFEAQPCLQLDGEGKRVKRGLFSISLALMGPHRRGSGPRWGDDDKKTGLLQFCRRPKPSPQRGATFVCRLSQLQQRDRSPHELSFPLASQELGPGGQTRPPSNTRLEWTPASPAK